MSIFIAGLAFDEPLLTDQAKIGVLLASAIAAGIGAIVLTRGVASLDAEVRPPTSNRSS